MAGDNKVHIQAGRDATLKGVAIGDGASATSVDGAWPEAAVEQFAQLHRLIAEAQASGKVTEGQVRALTETTAAAESDLKDAADPVKKETGGFKLRNLIRDFNDFCGDERGKGVIACAKALASIFGISMAVLGLPG